MSLQSGQSLGHYRLVEKIGEGGMGVVWKAEDTKLGRPVAVKVLPEAVSSDPERLARFEREARVLASLSHQNIAAIHQVEEVDGCHFLVMELAQGEDLAAHIQSAPLPPEEAMAVALQIVEALEAAHARGIVHRDLKPANIMVSPAGEAKVLDFGLAKAWDTEGTEGSGEPSMSPTLTANMTQAGVILGTAAYMSPEQARGKPVDQRADIWAFGCVLYEMLSGRQAFGGETVTDILGAIVHKEPDWEALPSTTPRHVRRVLERCVTKDPKQRFHAAGDVRIALTDIEEETDRTEIPARGDATSLVRMAYAAAVVVAVVLGIAGGRLLWPTSPSNTLPVSRYSLKVEPVTPDAGTLAVSPDGRFVIYPGGNPPMLHVRHMDRFESVPVAGTEGAQSVILSPDSRWIVFTAGTQVRKVRLGGGPPVTLHDFAPLLVGSSGGAWASDGILYLGLQLANDYGALYRLPAAGGAPEILIPRDDPDGVPVDRSRPQLMPDGRTLIYTSVRGNRMYSAKYAETRALDLRTGRERKLLEAAGAARYFHSGHILASSATDSWTVTPVDPSTLEITGATVPLPRAIGTEDGGMTALIDSTAQGTAVFKPVSAETGGDELLWLGLKGSRESIVSDVRDLQDAVLSPDGSRIAIISGEPAGGKLLIYDLQRESLSSLIIGGKLAVKPIWSPDGNFIYFLGHSEGSDPGLFRSPVDGSAAPEQIADPRTIWLYPSSVSPDGNLIASYIWDPDTEADWNLWIVSADGSVPPSLFLKEDAYEVSPRFSADGRWLAFMSNRTGTEQIYIKRFPEEGGLYQVSDGGGNHPQWTPDGKGLVYVSDDRTELYHADLDLSGSPQISKPRKVMDIPADVRPARWRPFGSIAPDGQRYLVIRHERRVIDRLAVVENWFPELRELAPVRN